MSEKRNFGEAEEWFHQKATDYVVAQAMFHLNQEGVLSALNMSRTSVSAEELAAERNLDSDKLATLLLYLASVDRVFTHEPPDRFALTSFGRTVVQRYGKTTESGLLVNMFDVRVGAYGPVWNSIGDLVSGRSTYGEEVQRKGRFSERGLYATARGMGPSLLEALDDQSGPVVEMGVALAARFASAKLSKLMRKGRGMRWQPGRPPLRS